MAGMKMRGNLFKGSARAATPNRDVSYSFGPTLRIIKRANRPLSATDVLRYLVSTGDKEAAQWLRQAQRASKTKMGPKTTVRTAQDELYGLQIFQIIKDAHRKAGHRNFEFLAAREMAEGAAGLPIELETLRAWKKKWRKRLA